MKHAPWLFALVMVGCASTTPPKPGSAQPRRPKAPVVIASGVSHTCAQIGGVVKCWGQNSSGQLGDGTRRDRVHPVTVKALGPVQALGLGKAHTCAVDGSGTVKCWGADWAGSSSGKPGKGVRHVLEPLAVAGVPKARAVAAGSRHSCALTASGVVWCWGSNMEGQLASPATDQVGLAARQVAGLPPIAAIAIGGETSWALDRQGQLWGWGSTHFEELQDNPGFGCKDATNRMACRTTPKVVERDVAQVDAVRGGVCVLTTGGSARCWGYFRNLRTRLAALSPNDPIVEVRAMFRGACARHRSGRVGCARLDPCARSWKSCRLDGRTGSFQRLSLESSYGCGLTRAGGVSCWGQHGNAVYDAELWAKTVPVPWNAGDQISAPAPSTGDPLLDMALAVGAATASTDQRLLATRSVIAELQRRGSLDAAASLLTPWLVQARTRVMSATERVKGQVQGWLKANACAKGFELLQSQPVASWPEVGGELGSCGGKHESPRYLDGLLRRLESLKGLKAWKRVDAYAWLAERFEHAMRHEPAKSALGKALDATLKMSGIFRSSAEEAVGRAALRLGDRWTWQRVLYASKNQEALRVVLARTALELPHDKKIGVELVTAAVKATVRPKRETVDLAGLLHGLGKKKDARKLLDRIVRAYRSQANPNYPKGAMVLTSGDSGHIIYRSAVDALERLGHPVAARRAAEAMGRSDQARFQGIRLASVLARQEFAKAATLVKGLKADLRRGAFRVALDELRGRRRCAAALKWLPSVDVRAFSLDDFAPLSRACPSGPATDVEQALRKWLALPSPPPKGHHRALHVETRAAAGQIDQAITLLEAAPAAEPLSACLVALSRQLQSRKQSLTATQRGRVEAAVGKVAGPSTRQ